MSESEQHVIDVMQSDIDRLEKIIERQSKQIANLRLENSLLWDLAKIGRELRLDQ